MVIWDSLVGKHQILTCSAILSRTVFILGCTTDKTTDFFIISSPIFFYLTRLEACYVWLNKDILDSIWPFGICSYTVTCRPLRVQPLLEYDPCGINFSFFFFFFFNKRECISLDILKKFFSDLLDQGSTQMGTMNCFFLLSFSEPLKLPWLDFLDFSKSSSRVYTLALETESLLTSFNHVLFII